MIQPDAIARDFPSLAGKCYLNTAAESIPPRPVIKAVQEYLEDKLLGMDGREAHFAREAKTRASAATLLELTAEEVGFCSCSAEAYNLLASALALKPDDEVVINDLDFPSGATPWLAARAKPLVRVWKSRDDGTLDLGDMVPLLSPRTQLVQVSLVSFYNGWRLPWLPFLNTVRNAAPQAVVSVDLTQALGRCHIECEGADILISSTHKWLLGLHGGCVVGIPRRSADRLTSAAGGWYHLRDAFEANRFEKAVPKPGAASFAVGMPSFAPIYALGAGVDYLLAVGVEAIVRHADPLVRSAYEGLFARGIAPLASYDPSCPSGILAFRHPESARIHSALRVADVHVMHHADRLRLSFHGYNTAEDVARFFHILDSAL